MASQKRWIAEPSWSRGLSVLGSVPTLAALPVQEKPDPDKGVTALEDLTKERWVLNRCLLIYEEGIRRLQGKKAAAPEIFH